MVFADRVLLIGMGITAQSALEGLLDGFPVIGVVRDAVRSDAVIQAACRAGAEIEADLSIKSVDAFIERLNPDCIVVSSFNRILPSAIVGKRPFVNVHYAPLPRYRGRATVNWAIINGESHTAISIHELVPNLDAGSLLFQQRMRIHDRDTVTGLYDRLNAIQRTALAPTVARFLAGYRGVPQDESQATYSCSRLPEDGEILWTNSAVEIDRLVRALTEPFPGAFTWFGKQRLVVCEAEPVTGARYEGVIPGRVIRINRASGCVDVLTGNGIIRLNQVSLDGERWRAADILNSTKATLGFSASRAFLDMESERIGRPEDTTIDGSARDPR